MQVLFTIAIIAVLAMWALAVYSRLARLRAEVTLAWKRLEPNQSDEAVRTVYNRHVAIYNAALDGFPGYIVGPLAGFAPARPFGPKA